MALCCWALRGRACVGESLLEVPAWYRALRLEARVRSWLRDAVLAEAVRIRAREGRACSPELAEEDSRAFDANPLVSDAHAWVLEAAVRSRAVRSRVASFRVVLRATFCFALRGAGRSVRFVGFLSCFLLC